jgi:VanZ family protein
MPGRAWIRSTWWPVVGWLLVIVGLSSIPDLGTREQKIPWSDKIAHVCEYGVLGVLWARAVSAKRGGSRRMIVVAALLGLVIGSLDEWYQTRTPGRTSGPADVVADVIGAALGSAAWISGAVQRMIRFVLRRDTPIAGRKTP